jgi:RpiR family carbohydrate utilization transcriptional regulator
MSKKDQSSKPVVLPLAKRIDELSAKRQEIIRPILEHPREYVLLSVRDLAKRLHTDPATIIRIVRGLGFETYREFQRHLHEMSLAFATSLDTFQTRGPDDSMSGYVRDSISRDVKNLQGLMNSIDAPRLVTLAKRIYDARRIVVLAGDLAVNLGQYLEYHLLLLGLPAFAGTSPGRILHLVRSLNKRDLVVSISFRRGLRQTVEGTHIAHDRGAYCVAIADTYLSPLATLCDESFLAPVESTTFATSYCAPVALINAILAACAQYRREDTLEIVKELAEEQRKGFRWYNT